MVFWQGLHLEYLYVLIRSCVFWNVDERPWGGLRSAAFNVNYAWGGGGIYEMYYCSRSNGCGEHLPL